MKVAVLQSNYLPWKGYFDLINDVDLFVFYDEVQYTKDEYIQMIAEKNETLERDLTDTQLAIAEIYESLA